MGFSDDLMAVADELCALREKGDFAPLLEADVTGCLFHLLVNDGHCSLKEIHLDTRVSGVRSNAKFDIAIGAVEFVWDRKPSIRPTAVIEVKAFPIGLGQQQYRHRLEHILNDDLRKLGELPAGIERIQFIYDEADYLSGRYGGKVRHSVLLARRDDIAIAVSLLFLRRVRGEWKTSVE